MHDCLVELAVGLIEGFFEGQFFPFDSSKYVLDVLLVGVDVGVVYHAVHTYYLRINIQFEEHPLMLKP